MEDTNKRAKGLVVLAILLILFALGTALSWVQHFTADMAEMEAKWGNLDHENALLWADAYMTLCVLACAFGLLRRRAWGLFFGLSAGSAITFLGLVETLFALQRGWLRGLSSESVETGIICAILLVLGPVTSIYLWRERANLLER